MRLPGRVVSESYSRREAFCQSRNSAGPLLDEFGAVVGLVQSALNDARLLMTPGVVAQNLNDALKSEYLLRFLKSVPASR